MGPLIALAGRRLYLDANVVIYALEDVAPYTDVTRHIWQAIDAGECSAVTSELTLGECLVKPLELGRTEVVQAYLDGLQTRSSFAVVPVRREILIEAARLRACFSLKLPDAIHAATAVLSQCDLFVTNDKRLRAIPNLDVVLLSEAIQS